jgi:hypothetical protein
MGREWNVVTTGLTFKTGRFGGQAVRGNAGLAGNIAFSRTITASATKAIGFAIEFFSPLAGFTQTFLSLRETTTVHLGLALDAAGHIFLWRGSTATVLATSTEVFTTGVVYHLGLKVTVNDTTGAYDLYLNGSTLLFSATNVDTRNGGTSGVINTVAFILTATNQSAYIDDFYIHDCSNSAPYNDLLGDVYVETNVPASNGAFTQWSVSGAATQPEAVDEATANDDTDYITESVSTERHTFVFDALTGSPADIYGVKYNAVARKDDASSVQYQITLRSSSEDNDDGTVISPASSYEHKSEYWSLDPSTGNQFTAADVTTTEGGVVIV